MWPFYSMILALFVMLIVGFVARKTGIIDDKASKALSTAVIKIGQPFMIIGSMVNVEFSTERLKNGFMVLGISLLLHGLIAVVAYFAVFKYKSLDERKISEFAVVFGNCGFIGFPLIQSVLGDEGLFYASFFIISFNLFLWTWGIAIFARKRSDIKITPKSMILNFGTIPCIIGILIYSLQIPIPDFLKMSFDYLGGICTPLSMLITGALLGTAKIKEIFADLKAYYVSFLKLIVAPVISAIVCYAFRLNSFYIIFMAIMFAMPTATSAVMFGELFETEKRRASILCGLTSLLSMLTMPLLISALNDIFS